jgi:hypothetical protein
MVGDVWDSGRFLLEVLLGREIDVFIHSCFSFTAKVYGLVHA